MADFFVASLGRDENALDWSQLVAFSASQPRSAWTVPEAFVAILFAAATCDGELAGEEHDALLALVHRSRALKTLNKTQLADVNATVVARLRDNPKALKQACAALPQDMRLPVFAHALDLALADGELREEEADFMNTLILELGVDGRDVERIADVIVLKNRY